MTLIEAQAIVDNINSAIERGETDDFDWLDSIDDIMDAHVKVMLQSDGFTSSTSNEWDKFMPSVDTLLERICSLMVE